MNECLRIDGTGFTSPDDPIFLERLSLVIHPSDNMVPQGKEERYYFWIGKTALDCIQAVAPGRSFQRILDLPSGYGRVLRFLCSAYPDADIFACEIVEGALAFCAEQFGVTPVTSSQVIGEIRLPGKFDLIWVGSLFSHLNERSANDFFSLFRASLAEGGLLAFSVEAETGCQMAEAGDNYFGTGGPDAIRQAIMGFRKNGFGFAPFKPGVTDLSDYGVTFIREDWLDARCRDHGFQKVAFITRGYARCQDVAVWSV